MQFSWTSQHALHPQTPLKNLYSLTRSMAVYMTCLRVSGLLIESLICNLSIWHLHTKDAGTLRALHCIRGKHERNAFSKTLRSSIILRRNCFDLFQRYQMFFFLTFGLILTVLLRHSNSFLSTAICYLIFLDTETMPGFDVHIKVNFLWHTRFRRCGQYDDMMY